MQIPYILRLLPLSLPGTAVASLMPAAAASSTAPHPAAREEGSREQERDLVERSCSGDSDAFARLVQLHHRRVWRLCARFFDQRSDVEDAAQDTFLRCWEKLHTYRHKAPFEHWLTRLCLNTCYTKLRQRQPETASSAEQEVEAVPARDNDRTAPVDAERLLAQLSPVDRFVLVLLEAHGWSTNEVAERLGWSRVNVKVRAHRARRRLRALAEGSGSLSR